VEIRKYIKMKYSIILGIILFPTILFGQNIVVKSSINDSDMPEITWFTTGRIDTTEFKVYRSVPKEHDFVRINTIHFVREIEESDTIEFIVIDTSLVDLGIYTYFIQVERDKEVVDSETAIGHNFGLVPKPRLLFFTSKALTDRKAIELSWKLVNSSTVSSMSLYRSEFYDTAYIKVAELSAEMESFIDVVPRANEPLYYFMVIHDYFGNQLPSVRSPAFATFAEKPIRPQNLKGSYSNDSIELTWQNAGANIIGYRVKRSVDNKAFLLVNDMSANTGSKQVFVDDSPEVHAASNIAYYVVNVSDGFVESNSSDTLSFYIAEHEKVLPPQELDCFMNTRSHVKLLWIAPDQGLVIGYNVYIIPPSGDTVKLNAEMLVNNNFADTLYRSEGKYTYLVESVGFMNKISKNTISTTIIHYSPKNHVILDLKRLNDGIRISWKRSLDEHISSLKLYRQHGDNKAEVLNLYTNKTDVIYDDTNLLRGYTYHYSLVATLLDGSQLIVNKGVQMSW